MADLNRMKKKAAKRLQSGETDTFDKEARKHTRGEAFEPTKHQGDFYPPLPWTRSGTSYFKIGHFKHTDGRITYVTKHSSNNGPKYHVVPDVVLYDAMEKCDDRRVAWEDVKAAQNKHPIKFTWKKKEGILAPVPNEIYARKIGSAAPRQSVRSPPKPSNDSAIAKAAQASAKARAKKKRKSRSKSTQTSGYAAAKKKVSFDEPESDSDDSVGLSLSESDSSSSSEVEDNQLSEEASLWLETATATVRRCKIGKLIKYIGHANGDRLLSSFQRSGVSVDEVLGTENLIHLAEVAKTNTLAGKTPGMVRELVRICETTRAPKRVVLFARKMFTQAIDDIISLFTRKLGPGTIVPVETMDERAKLLHTRIMYNMPEITPYSDLVLSTDGTVAFLDIMNAIKAHVEQVIPTQLEAYKYLFMLVYVYGLTFGFVLVPGQGIKEGLFRPSSKL